MARALVTFATGTHTELLDIARPSFEAFADRHGYDLVEPVVESDRPPSWWKVPALRACLDEYDEALWIDADIVIVDGTDDLPVDPDCWQALVRHHTGDGQVPNCGMWYVRQEMKPVLDRVWSMKHRLNHGWWEQSALMDLLGYRVDPRPSRLMLGGTDLYKKTCWLDSGWNVHPWDTVRSEHPRFQHATMYPDRPAKMREWAAAAV